MGEVEEVQLLCAGVTLEVPLIETKMYRQKEHKVHVLHLLAK